MGDDSEPTLRNLRIPASDRRSGDDRRRRALRGTLANMRFAFNRRHGDRRRHRLRWRIAD